MNTVRRAVFAAGAAVFLYAAVAGLPVAAITGHWLPAVAAAGLCVVPFCRCVAAAIEP